MVRLTVYDRTKTYFTPDMKELTPEQASGMFSIVNSDIECIIYTDKTGNFLYTAPKPTETMADELGLNENDYSDITELLMAMEDILNAPQPEPEPSAEERIASAMEYQNLMME